MIDLTYIKKLIKKVLKEELEVYDNSKGGKFWGDAGSGILPIAKDTGRILIALRSEYVNEPHTYGVWGGKIDNDQKPKESAIREFKEETKYSGEMEVIPAYVFHSNDNTFKYYNFIALLNTEFKPMLNWETSDYKWVTFDELQTIPNLHFGIKDFIKSDYELIKKYSN